MISLARRDEITTPAEFSKGGHKKARLHFSQLATLFSVISKYDKALRWRDQAARIFGRTAANYKVGTVQSYHDAKVRSEQLADLVRGEQIQIPDRFDRPIDAWNNTSEPVPLMSRMDVAVGETLHSLQLAHIVTASGLHYIGGTVDPRNAVFTSEWLSTARDHKPTGRPKMNKTLQGIIATNEPITASQ